MSYYNGLFGHNDPYEMKLNHNFWPDNLSLSEDDRVLLVKHFCSEEIKEVVMHMKENSALGPNGYGVVFFKNCRKVLKGDFSNMFSKFYDGLLDIKRLNYGVITLVPKLKEANNIKQYRPICLLNVDFKCFTKVLTNRLVPIAREIIGENQTGFVKGRNILEGVVVLHEVLHELSRSKKKGLILKIDFEKSI